MINAWAMEAHENLTLKLEAYDNWLEVNFLGKSRLRTKHFYNLYFKASSSIVSCIGGLELLKNEWVEYDPCACVSLIPIDFKGIKQFNN